MKALTSIIITLILLTNYYTVQSQVIQHATITVDNKIRPYILYAPAGLQKNAPLFFVIHGFTDNAENMMRTTNFNSIADREGFALCYSQGLPDKEGRNFWEVGYDFTRDIHKDDVKFLTTLAMHLQDSLQCSKQHTFVTGMSNGAEMCILLAVSSKGIFKAIAPVCGCLMKKVYDTIRNIQPVPVFMINSTADQTTSWEGDMENKQQ